VKPGLLFVYGSLKRGMEADLTNLGGRYVGEGYANECKMFRLAPHGYAALVECPREAGKIVYGDIFSIKNQKVWDGLDRYETKAYMRKIMPITLVDQGEDSPAVDAWVYVYADVIQSKDIEIFSGRYEY
jgi:gamma-glutamylcyclotransferase (GGCT)/AIG2-like uncharacterized protein YtfP